MPGKVNPVIVESLTMVVARVVGNDATVGFAQTGSLLPCIALHSLNNSLAFGVTQGWTWQIPLLMVVSLAILTLILTPIVRRAALAVP